MVAAALDPLLLATGLGAGPALIEDRVGALVACGPRTVMDATFGSTSTGETTYAPRLLGALRPRMIVLGDRNFAAQALIAAIAATGADLQMDQVRAPSPGLSSAA